MQNSRCAALALKVSQEQCCWQCCACCNHRNVVMVHGTWYYTLLRNCNGPLVCQVSRISTHQEVKKPSQASLCSVMSQSSYRTYCQPYTSLSRLFTESSSRSEEGRGDQQMLPKLLNKAISTKSTQYIS